MATSTTATSSVQETVAATTSTLPASPQAINNETGSGTSNLTATNEDASPIAATSRHIDNDTGNGTNDNYMASPVSAEGLKVLIKKVSGNLTPKGSTNQKTAAASPSTPAGRPMVWIPPSRPAVQPNVANTPSISETARSTLESHDDVQPSFSGETSVPACDEMEQFADTNAIFAQILKIKTERVSNEGTEPGSHSTEHLDTDTAVPSTSFAQVKEERCASSLMPDGMDAICLSSDDENIQHQGEWTLSLI